MKYFVKEYAPCQQKVVMPHPTELLCFIVAVMKHAENSIIIIQKIEFSACPMTSGVLEPACESWLLSFQELYAPVVTHSHY
jgi:hypothetical protein